LLTKGHGVLIGVVIEGVHRHDMKLVCATIANIVVERPQGMGLDKGADDEDVRATVREVGLTAHMRSRGEEVRDIAHEAGKRARRWAVPC